MPITKPVNESMVAMAGFPAVHTPPVVVSITVIVSPMHIAALPEMGEGKGFTVNEIVSPVVKPMLQSDEFRTEVTVTVVPPALGTAVAGTSKRPAPPAKTIVELLPVDVLEPLKS